MKSTDARLSKLELVIKGAAPVFDWTATQAYADLSPADRDKLHSFAERFTAAGLSDFSDEELTEFEHVVAPFHNEELRNASEI